MEKMPQKPMECFRLLFDHLSWIEYQFLSGIRVFEGWWEAWKGKEVNTPELIGQGLGLELLCWGFKGVQEEIPLEEASTLQIRLVAFPPGKYTSPQLHPCHRLFDQDGHQDNSSAFL